jgi:hypothetical protein
VTRHRERARLVSRQFFVEAELKRHQVKQRESEEDIKDCERELDNIRKRLARIERDDKPVEPGPTPISKRWKESL